MHVEIFEKIRDEAAHFSVLKNWHIFQMPRIPDPLSNVWPQGAKNWRSFGQKIDRSSILTLHSLTHPVTSSQDHDHLGAYSSVHNEPAEFCKSQSLDQCMHTTCEQKSSKKWQRVFDLCSYNDHPRLHSWYKRRRPEGRIFQTLETFQSSLSSANFRRFNLRSSRVRWRLLNKRR